MCCVGDFTLNNLWWKNYVMETLFLKYHTRKSIYYHWPGSIYI